MTKTATTEKPVASFGLKALDKIKPAAVFAPGGIDAILAKIDAEVRPAEIDITTKAGRETIASAAYKVARSKTFLDDMGKELVADWKKQSAAVDADRRKLRDRLDTLKDEIRQPLTDWENAESTRVEQHETALASLPAMLADTGDRTPAEIEAMLQELGEIAQRDWQEYEARAVSTIDHVRAGLRKELAAAQQREADRAELEELRQKQAERERKDNEERIAQEAADRANEAAQQAIADADRRAQEAEDRRIASEQQAERDREAAVAAERERLEADQRAEKAAAERREKNKRHAAKINNEVLTALEGCGVETALAKTVIASIVRGEIPHTKISY